MTDNEILEVARKSGFEVHDVRLNFRKELITFARRIAAMQREEIAVMVDELEEHYSGYCNTALLNGDMKLSLAASGEPRACRFIAEKIREQSDE